MISKGIIHILEDESCHYQDDCCQFYKTLIIFYGILHILADTDRTDGSTTDSSMALGFGRGARPSF